MPINNASVVFVRFFKTSQATRSCLLPVIVDDGTWSPLCEAIKSCVTGPAEKLVNGYQTVRTLFEKQYDVHRGYNATSTQMVVEVQTEDGLKLLTFRQNDDGLSAGWANPNTAPLFHAIPDQKTFDALFVYPIQRPSVDYLGVPYLYVQFKEKIATVIRKQVAFDKTIPEEEMEVLVDILLYCTKIGKYYTGDDITAENRVFQALSAGNWDYPALQEFHRQTALPYIEEYGLRGPNCLDVLGMSDPTNPNTEILRRRKYVSRIWIRQQQLTNVAACIMDDILDWYKNEHTVRNPQQTQQEIAFEAMLDGTWNLQSAQDFYLQVVWPFLSEPAAPTLDGLMSDIKKFLAQDPQNGKTLFTELGSLLTVG